MTEVEKLLQEAQELRSIIERQASEIAVVNAELAETNKGVVALYAELDDRAEQLRQATELKSRFLSYMSHEFRTPLGSIVSLSRVLMDHMDGPLTDEQERQVRLIRGSAEELIEMVNDLLDLAKVEAGRISISPEWFEMVDLFSALRGMFKPIISKQSVDLIFEEPKNVPMLFTDHKKLSQILRNYISNALKFTQKGSVRVSAECKDSEMVIFSVADTGIGIAKEHQKELFNDFVQVDSPVQKHLRGTGLGLSLSKKLAELLGGNVGIEGDLGKGSIFSVTVPVRLPGYTGNENREESKYAG